VRASGQVAARYAGLASGLVAGRGAGRRRCPRDVSDHQSWRPAAWAALAAGLTEGTGRCCCGRPGPVPVPDTQERAAGRSPRLPER